MPDRSVDSAPRTAQTGFTVVEALAVLLLLLLVLHVGWTLTAGVARAAAELADRGESVAASRATAWILQEELEGARAAADAMAPRGDSLALRAFRGSALVCAVLGPDELVVRVAGIRRADATKDSLLVLTSAAGWSVRALAARVGAPGRCGDGPDGDEERWTLDRPVAGALLLRWFERGSYHLADDSFRYRIGAAGRQPLTPPNLDPARSALTGMPGGRIVLEVGTRGAHRGRTGPEVRRVYRLPGAW